MRIYLVRSGGFAGIPLTVTIDSATLSMEEAVELLEMVESANFFNLPPLISAREPGADRFQYKVIIEREGKQHSVEIQEAAIPPTLRPLLQWLTAAALKR